MVNIVDRRTFKLRNYIESVEVYEQSAGECDLCLSNYNIFFFQVATNDEDSG